MEITSKILKISAIQIYGNRIFILMSGVNLYTGQCNSVTYEFVMLQCFCRN